MRAGVGQLILVAALLMISAAAGYGLGGVGKGALEAELAAVRSEQLVQAVDSAGWQTRVQEATADLERRLQESVDSTDALSVANAELARQADLLGGQIRTITDMYAALRDTIVAEDVEVHAAAPDAEPDSVTAELDDGLLEGQVAYRFGDPYWLGSFALRYGISIEMSQSFVELPDGRLLAAARARDPRVQLRFEDTYWQPPPPVEYCSVGTRARWGLYGAAASQLATVVGSMVR